MAVAWTPKREFALSEGIERIEDAKFEAPTFIGLEHGRELIE
jgi:hypothetical protein